LKSLVAEVLGICRKLLYYQPKQPDKDNALADQIMTAHEDHPDYGQKRMAIHLQVNHKRTERVMRQKGIKPPRNRVRFHSCTVSTHNHEYTNIVKDIPLSEYAPNVIWVGDVSYLKYRGGFWYLVTIIDVCTRKVISAWVGKHHDSALVFKALKQAILLAGCTPQYFHTDQGKEFMARVITTYLELQGTQVSVSDVASPWQNGYQESFFGRFKQEFGDVNRFETVSELIEAIYSQIHYYNYDRIHTSLKMSPVQYARLFSDNSSHKRGT